MAPSAISVFKKTGIELSMETGAGVAAGFPDAEYAEKGVRVAVDRAEVFAIRRGRSCRCALPAPIPKPAAPISRSCARARP